MKLKLRSALSLIILAQLALVGCANNQDNTADKENTVQEEVAESQENDKEQASAESPSPVADDFVQGITDDEVIVANTAAVSGAYAPVGQPFVSGIEGYFKYINENGGVNGRKITFKHVDDEFAPDKGKAALQQMVEDEKVFAIVGHFGTPVVSATVEDLKEYGIPTVYFATGIGQLYNDHAVGADRNLFPVQPIYITEGSIMVARGVGDYGAKKIGVLFTNDDAGKNMLEGAKKKAEELGVELVSEQVQPGATDVSAAVTSLLAKQPDFILGASIQETFPTIVKALGSQGNTAPVITTYVNVAPVIAESLANEASQFDILGNGWVDFTQETAVEELKTYTQYMPEEYHQNAYAITGWIAGQFFTEGLKRIPEGESVTWKSYMDALEAEPILNPFGGEIDFTEGKRLGTTVMNLSKIEGNAWTPLKGLESMDDILSGK